MSDLEQKSALRMLSLMAVLLLLLGVAGVMVWPLASEFTATQLAPGLGMRDAAVVSFFLTVVTLVGVEELESSVKFLTRGVHKREED